MQNGLSALMAYKDPNARFTPEIPEAPVSSPPVMPAPKANGLAPANPPMAPKPKMQNGLLGSTLDAFQRGLDPAGRKARIEEGQATDKESMAKEIATLQGIRKLPVEQRMALLPQISQAMGQPIPESTMSDAELDAALAIRMGEAGMVEEPMTAYQQAQLAAQEAERGKPDLFSTSKGIVSVADGKPELIYGTEGEQDLPTFRWATPEEVAAASLPPGTSMQINEQTGQAAVKSQPRSTTQYDPVTARKLTASVRGLDLLDQQISDYEKTLRENGGTKAIVALADKSQVNAIEAARNNVLVLAKELYELGALVGADFGIIESAIKPATGLGASLETTESITASLNQVKSMLRNKLAQVPEEIIEQTRKGYSGDMAGRFKAKPTAAGSGPAGLMRSMANAASTAMQGQGAPPKAPPSGGLDPELEADIDAAFAEDGDDEEAPEGIDPEDWQYMTPEQRALWRQ